jgi:hypothetical protein
MNRMIDRLGTRRDDSWQSYFSHMWIWVSAAAAGLLLMWFISVLNDITERGEQRRMHQRTSGTFLLPDELRSRGTAAAHLVTTSSPGAADLR